MVMMAGRGAFAPLSFPVRRRGLGHPDANGVRRRQGCGGAGSVRGRYGGNGTGGKGSALFGGMEGRNGRGGFKRENKRRWGEEARSEGPVAPSPTFQPWFVFPNQEAGLQTCHNITPTRVAKFPTR